MDELLPCPFCGVEIEGRNGGIFHPELPDESDCPLAGLSWSADYYGKLWNTRPTQPSGVTEDVEWLRNVAANGGPRFIHQKFAERLNRIADALAMRSAAPTSGEVERALVPEDWKVGDPRANAAWDAIMSDERLRIGGLPSCHQIRLIIGHCQRAFRDSDGAATGTASPDERLIASGGVVERDAQEVGEAVMRRFYELVDDPVAREKSVIEIGRVALEASGSLELRIALNDIAVVAGRLGQRVQELEARASASPLAEVRGRG